MIEREGLLDSLQAERLMAHMHALCKGIGPRPPTSAQERQAADYVRDTLARLQITDVQEQSFNSYTTLGQVVIPYLLAGAAGTLLGAWGGRLAKLLGGLMLLGGAYGLTAFLSGRPPFFRDLIANRTSQNVIATIPPRHEARRHVYLIGHLDTNKQRFMAPIPLPGLLKPLNTLALLLAAASGLAMLWRALHNRKGLASWQWIAGLVAFQALGGTLYDETQPYIEGANDNATAVAVLLGIAEALKAQPLEHTGVTLLFTGCEEVVCAGIEAYLEVFAPPKYNTYWIDLEMVGTGNICYVTRHGLSKLSEYAPAPEMVTIAARAAVRHPELTVAGKDMLILEEVASLINRGYKAVCVAGYNQEGYLPNWHRVTDTLERIEPGTLSRAARYTWAILQEIDNPSR